MKFCNSSTLQELDLQDKLGDNIGVHIERAEATLEQAVDDFPMQSVIFDTSRQETLTLVVFSCAAF